MLKKKNRFKKKEFTLFFKDKEVKRKYSDSFIFIYKNNYNDNFKYAVSVSKKIHKLAVRRNRIRRIIYKLLSEIIQETAKDAYDDKNNFKKKKYKNGIIILKKDILNKSKKKIKKELVWILK